MVIGVLSANTEIKDCFPCPTCYNPRELSFMASFSPEKLRLKVQAPKLKADKDPAFYVVPPLLVAAVFAFCAYVPRELLAFKRPSGVRVIAAQKMRVELPDPNTSLPEYEIPAGCANLLQGTQIVTASAEAEGTPASNAVNGSCADDAHVAVAHPADGQAWWQAELAEPAIGQELVIYGGGSKSPAGKFVGGFQVDVVYGGGSTESRSFCKEGFALEGYETWQLDGSQPVQSIRVSALGKDAPVVLREVQLIGPAH